MAITQPVPKVGQPRLCKRLADIRIPLFRAPYLIDSAPPTMGGFSRKSLWPMFFANQSTSGNTLPYMKAETVSLFAKGTVELNPANSAFSGGGNTGILRFGNEAIWTTNGQLSQKNIILDGVAVTTKSAQFLTTDKLGQSTGGVAFGGQLGGPMMMFDQMYPPFPRNQFYSVMCWNAGIFGAASYGFARTPFYGNISLLSPIPSQNLVKLGFENCDMWYGYNDSALPGGFFNYVPNASVPDIKNGLNHFLMNNANLNASGLIHWQVDANLGIGTLDPVVLDDLTLQGLMNFASGPNTKSTVYGFLIEGPASATYAPSQLGILMLMAPDCYHYALVQLEPQTGPVAVDVLTGSSGGGLESMIDPEGNFYLIGASPGNLDTSLSLQFPWQPITLPQLNNPFFLLPNACGCNPVDTLGMEGIAENIGGIYG